MDGEPVSRARVGVLSLQGDFALHAAALQTLGIEPVRVTLPEHLDSLEALVLPGGESSTMLRLLESTGLRGPLERFVAEKPVLGTCAGLILLAREADRLPLPTLGALDIKVVRNGYGRQIHSFSGPVEFAPLPDTVNGVFIRAPRILEVGKRVKGVAHRPAAEGAPREPVGVQAGRILGLAFHPELTGDLRFHRWFLSELAGIAVPRAENSATSSEAA